MLQGRINWSLLLQPICSRAIWFFDVPIGDDAYKTYKGPDFPVSLATQFCISAGGVRAGHFAKVLSYTLRDPLAVPSGGEDAMFNTHTSQGCIATICPLLEHYFQDNTAGR